MKNIFFILSTPRCRSTWFSNLFTYKNTFCYNEELRYMTKWSDFEDRIKSRSEKNIGFSDPELLHHIKKLYKLYPNAKYILLERDRAQAELSLHNISGVSFNLIKVKFNKWYENIDYFKKNIKKHYSIHWDQMDDFYNINSVWKYIMSEDMDKQRWELLTAMRVSVTDGEKPFPIKENCLAPYFNLNKLNNIK